MSRRARIGILGIATLLVAVYALLFGRQTYLVATTKYRLRHTPAIRVVPQPHELHRGSPGIGPTVRYFGYELELPWPEPAETRALKSLVAFRSRGGGSVVLFDPSSHPDAIGEQLNDGDARALRAIAGGDATRSTFAFYDAILAASPDQLSIFAPAETAAHTSLLLSMKGFLVGDDTTAIYSFAIDDLRGFQIGDPSARERVYLHVFDRDGRKIELVMGPPQGNGAPVSQADVDRVLTTLRPAAPHAATDARQP